MWRFATTPKMRHGRRRITMMSHFEYLADPQVPAKYEVNFRYPVGQPTACT